jgi:hypothetical protein
MEHYIFNCGKCRSHYSYVGYKTGIGKTQAQLKAMDDERHVCDRCGYDDREGIEKNSHDLDMGTNQSSESASFALDLFGDITNSDSPSEGGPAKLEK